ncbi:aldehyde dehydrogenase family protein [Brevibacillus sp. M2.1A]|uniref:aldehyde dehydrogenase family protein n=1 Tax=Brevibacillus sp. M2.1A TaxID=2738980 RepID=UPI00156BBF6E|nr:aldehyde dehydrogenase family protein [Brevibacillus sp. M2.1A]MCC8438546.1 aldehyde dehydrogenase family protein [Brevibacillus sp. M2.1A]
MNTKSSLFVDINKQFINGVWKEGKSSKVGTIYDPFDNSLFTKVTLATKDDIDEAYQVAKAAQKQWAKTPVEEKMKVMENAIRILEEHKEEFMDVFTREAGSSSVKANFEVQLAINIMKESVTFPKRMEMRAFPSEIVPGKENHVYREPAGVVSVISPFNFPFYLSMRSIAPAIATGNAVVHKPDLQTAISGGAVIAKLFERAGLPKGVLNVIITDITEIGDHFVEHPIPQVVSFTGSTPVGRHIGALAGKHLKKVALELGGNSPFIVLEDADIKQAVDAAVFGKFIHQGQICMIINRMFVHRSVYNEFTEAFVKRVSQLPYGDPKDPSTVIGPIINQRQIEKILKLVETAKEEGAQFALEGKRVGNVLTPFILTNVSNQMTIAQNEIFGPVASIIPFDTEQEAIDWANDTEYGLSAAVFTSDLERGERIAREIESGMAHVNDQSVNDEPTIPFGGEKFSGLGRYGGEWALDEFTRMKWVSVQKEKREYPF